MQSVVSVSKTDNACGIECGIRSAGRKRGQKSWSGRQDLNLRPLHPQCVTKKTQPSNLIQINPYISDIKIIDSVLQICHRFLLLINSVGYLLANLATSVRVAYEHKTNG